MLELLIKTKNIIGEIRNLPKSPLEMGIADPVFCAARFRTSLWDCS